MPIAIACPACGKKYKINEDRFGRKLKCQCGEVFRAPGEKIKSVAAPMPTDDTVMLPPPVSQTFDDIPNLAPPDPAPTSPDHAPWDAVWSPTAGTAKAKRPPAILPKDPPKTIAPARTTATPVGFVWDAYSRSAISVMVLCFIGFAAPDYAAQLRAFRHMKPTEVALGASFFMVIAVGMMFYAQRNNRKLAFGLSVAMLACIGIGWLITPARKPAMANVPQIVNPPPVIVPHQAPIRPQIPQQPDIDAHEIAQPAPPQFAPQHPQPGMRPPLSDSQRAAARKFRFDKLPSHAEVVTYSEPLGGIGGGEFATIDNNLRPVVGFHYEQQRWMGGNAFKKIEPIYDRSLAAESEVVAKEGYAVAGLVADASQWVRAIRVIFMKLDADRFDPLDTYRSDWIGNPSADETKTLAGGGQLVVGVYGGKGIVVDSVGLILKKQ